MQRPRLVAHRGYTLHYPENTLPAVEAAIQAGARHVEVDVQLSQDGVPFLFHDPSLKRVCGENGTVQDYTAAQLKSFSAGEHTRFGDRFLQVRLATLGEFAGYLQGHPAVSAFIELKEESILHFSVNEVLNSIRLVLAPILGQCILISFDLEAMAVARMQGWPRVGAVIEHWKERKRVVFETLNPDFVFCDVNGLPRRGRIERPGSKVVIYEVDDAQRALDLSHRGVEYIETFAFGELQRDLQAAAS